MKHVIAGSFRQVAVLVGQYRPRAGIEIVCLQLGYAHIHAAQVLELRVERLRVEASRPRDDTVKAVHVIVGVPDGIGSVLDIDVRGTRCPCAWPARPARHELGRC